MTQVDPNYEGLPPGYDVVFDFSIPTAGYPQPGYDVVFDFSAHPTFTTARSVTGELVVTDLTTTASSLGTLVCRTGEVGSFDLLLDWKVIFHAGELAQVTTISIAQLLGNITMWHGELGHATISAAYAVVPSARDGQKTACTLTPGQAANLGIIPVPTGERGAVGTINAAFNLPSAGTTGEKASGEIEIHPLILFVTNVMPTGEKIINALASFVQPVPSGRTGEKTACDLTVTGPTTVRMKTGEVALVELNQGFTIIHPLGMRTGECIISTTLNTRPAANPVVTFVTGEKAIGDLTVHPTAHMTAIAKSGEEFWAAMKGQTRWIDLGYDRNGPDAFYTWWDDVYNQQGNWVIIDTYENDYPGIYHNVGCNQYATAQLSTRARFYDIEFRSGERMHHEQSAWILNWAAGNPAFTPIKALMGQAMQCQLEADIKVPLCFGNIIPDPDFVFIELSSPYGDPCESWWMKTGESAFVARNGFLVVPSLGHPVCPTGEVAKAELTPDPPWIVRMWTGERVKCELWNDPSMQPIFRTGERATARMQDLAANAQDGARAIVTAMHTNYDVFFDEHGCLENRYVPQTPDGDPDYANAPPATPRELDPFQHFILSHCE